MGRKGTRVASAGISDSAVRAATDHGWEHWFEVIDRAGIALQGHPAIARYLSASHHLSPWWSQMVTVAYERARGLRQLGQRRDGFAVSASKTVSIPLRAAYAAWADQKLRATWLDDPAISIRTARAPHAIRFTWKDGRSIVAVSCTARGAARTQVSVQHQRLPNAAVAERMRRYWHRQLDRLAATVA